MSNTQYARNKILRIDEQDRQVLYRAVMRSIEIISSEVEPHVELRERELRGLRSLLDQIEEL